MDCLELVVRLLLHGSGPDWLLVSDPEVASFRGKTGRCCNHQPDPGTMNNVLFVQSFPLDQAVWDISLL